MCSSTGHDQPKSPDIKHLAPAVLDPQKVPSAATATRLAADGMSAVVVVYQSASSQPVTFAISPGGETVSESVPAGLTLVSMAGTGWACTTGSTTCTRSDVLNGGQSYAVLTVTVSVANDASASLTNQVSVSGMGFATATGSDLTTISPQNPCAVSRDGATTVSDVQLILNEALGVVPAVHDLNRDGFVNIVDVQKVINSALGLGCPTS